MEKNSSSSSTFTFVSTDKLGERQRRKLEEKRADLEEEYHLLCEKLKRLRKAKVIETDPSIEFKLEQQIEEIQQDILSLEQELDKIERELS
jgi:chromosome segregation ATPase